MLLDALNLDNINPILKIRVWLTGVGWVNANELEPLYLLSLMSDKKEASLSDYKLSFFTTIWDKNQKEVYTGDIMKFKDNNDLHYGLIEWGRGGMAAHWVFSLIYTNDKKSHLSGGSVFNLAYIFRDSEVIDNVFENPEWLERIKFINEGQEKWYPWCTHKLPRLTDKLPEEIIRSLETDNDKRCKNCKLIL